ncbi:endolytic transglycosylase MltG [Neomicrococcus lactis]|uniref:Endolytic murein transglycosylase n=1 Tax=Neomicrococcus lactis TaxID=732241 RepID=A0A7W8YA77_9MICC|nr:UPF0755 protein [Neomicrococcus lactis]
MSDPNADESQFVSRRERREAERLHRERDAARSGAPEELSDAVVAPLPDDAAEELPHDDEARTELHQVVSSADSEKHPAIEPYIEADERQYPEREDVDHNEGHVLFDKLPPTVVPVPTGTAPTTNIRQQRRKRRNKIMSITFGIFAVALVGVIFLIQSLVAGTQPADYAGPGTGDMTFEVKEGWGPIQISRQLQQEDIVASDKAFLNALEENTSGSSEIHPGTYDLKKQMKASDVVGVLTAVGPKLSYIALNENSRKNEVFQKISEATGVPVEDISAFDTKGTEFGLPATVKTLEGYLHPGEYRFPVDTPIKDMLQQMITATTDELKRIGITDPAQQYRVLTIASILQGEATAKDYPIVAGAIENRLNPNNQETYGLLQLDSTVTYGLGTRSLQFTEEQKKDASNEYNTYVHKGLPPTPIGSPGNSAIDAAAKPQSNEFYYWVTVNIETGETKFAKTYAEHQGYQQQFRDYCAANPDKCK